MRHTLTFVRFNVYFNVYLQNKINHSVIKDLLDPIKELYEDVRRKALMRLEYEGLHKSEAITTPGARFHNDPAGFAMNRYAYYVCYKCKKVPYELKSLLRVNVMRRGLRINVWPPFQAYFGGEARCDAEAGQGDDYDPSELICGACSDVSRAQVGSRNCIVDDSLGVRSSLVTVRLPECQL